MSFTFFKNPSPTLAATCLVVVLVGCAAEATDRQCTTGSQCASGMCSSSGSCLPKSDAALDTATVDAIVEDTAVTDETDAPKVGCSPNKDGVINVEEVPIAPGLKATFRVAENAAFATAGTAKPDGSRKWDLSVPLSGDHDVLVTTRALSGTWYGPKFPGASHSTELSTTSDLLGVFQTTATGLLLVGVVSPNESATKTELKYATPPAALQFPLKVSAAWKVTSNVSGTASGVAALYTETWDSRVDNRGELVTPFGSFDVMRVKTVLTRNVGVTVTITRTYAFVTECYGTIATVTSKPNETQEEFTSAAEVRRLSP